ncbi:hypothetical protein AEGHOMDF_5888 [Methylobacterium soli]|nr:hypothetical protein AEGHOMDF_5888 [Methylobacterium soli]
MLALFGMTAPPRLGVATMIAAVVCSQAVLSLLLARFSLFDLPAQHLSARRTLAATTL